MKPIDLLLTLSLAIVLALIGQLIIVVSNVGFIRIANSSVTFITQSSYRNEIIISLTLFVLIVLCGMFISLTRKVKPNENE